jgi:hypothetical protein
VSSLALYDRLLAANAARRRALEAEAVALLAERRPAAATDLALFRRTLPDKLKIYVSTPIDDGHKRCFWESLRAFDRTPDPAGHTYVWQTPPGDSLIPRARNNAAHDFFYNTDFDYLATVDSDEDFRPSDMWALVAHRLPIVCGTYYIKDSTGRPCINTLPGEETDPATGLRKIAKGGTGVMLTHRSVIAAMLAAAEWWPHWRIEYVRDHDGARCPHLYHHGVIHDPAFPHTPRDLSEDWSFCYLARTLGYDIYLDTRTVFLHRGEIDYPLHARRLSAEEMKAGAITQPDGTLASLPAPETV